MNPIIVTEPGGAAQMFMHPIRLQGYEYSCAPWRTLVVTYYDDQGEECRYGFVGRWSVRSLGSV